MAKFEREVKFVAMKISDIDKYLTPAETGILAVIMEKINVCRQLEEKESLECVCVESDWEIYEEVWKLVEEETERNR